LDPLAVATVNVLDDDFFVVDFAGSVAVARLFGEGLSGF
jgi:hypothetical protein